MWSFVHLSGNGIGDACEIDINGDGTAFMQDSDGDSVGDSYDNFPENREIYRTGFNKFMSVNLNTNTRTVKPDWRVYGNVRKSQISLLNFWED